MDYMERSKLMRPHHGSLCENISPRSILPYLPCLVASDKQNIEADTRNSGDFHGMQTLIDRLMRRPKGYEELLDSLTKIERNDLRLIIETDCGQPNSNVDDQRAVKDPNIIPKPANKFPQSNPPLEENEHNHVVSDDAGASPSNRRVHPANGDRGVTRDTKIKDISPELYTILSKLKGGPVSNNWENLAGQLGYTIGKVDQFVASDDPVRHMLQDWQTNPGSTIGQLVDALLKMKRHDMISDIKKLTGYSPKVEHRGLKRGSIRTTVLTPVNRACFIFQDTDDTEIVPTPVQEVGEPNWRTPITVTSPGGTVTDHNDSISTAVPVNANQADPLQTVEKKQSEGILDASQPQADTRVKSASNNTFHDVIQPFNIPPTDTFSQISDENNESGTTHVSDSKLGELNTNLKHGSSKSSSDIGLTEQQNSPKIDSLKAAYLEQESATFPKERYATQQKIESLKARYPGQDSQTFLKESSNNAVSQRESSPEIDPLKAEYLKQERATFIRVNPAENAEDDQNSMTEESADSHWARSDRFDTVLLRPDSIFENVNGNNVNGEDVNGGNSNEVISNGGHSNGDITNSENSNSSIFNRENSNDMGDILNSNGYEAASSSVMESDYETSLLCDSYESKASGTVPMTPRVRDLSLCRSDASEGSDSDMWESGDEASIPSRRKRILSLSERRRSSGLAIPKLVINPENQSPDLEEPLVRMPQETNSTHTRYNHGESNSRQFVSAFSYTMIPVLGMTLLAFLTNKVFKG